MPLTRPTLRELIDQTGSDIQSRLGLSGAVLRRSVVGVLARVFAGGLHLLYGFLAYLSQQILPDTAEGEFLARWASMINVPRKPATFATGEVVFSGEVGSFIPTNTQLQRNDGVAYVTQTPETLASTRVTVAIKAIEVGIGGNAIALTSLSLISPLAGIQTEATVGDAGITQGTDIETDDALRQRVLARLQRPPQGGAIHDYENWALEIPGVSRVWVTPLALGPNTVTVQFMMDAVYPNGIPQGGDVNQVQNHIELLRPVTAQVNVIAPMSTLLDLTLTIQPNTPAVQTAIENQLNDLLLREGVPGGVIRLSQIQEAISLAEGETDHVLIVPTSDVTFAFNEIPVLGPLTWN